jgi:hypothetical protein
MHGFPDHCVCWISYVLPQGATEQTVNSIRTYVVNVNIPYVEQSTKPARKLLTETPCHPS